MVAVAPTGERWTSETTVCRDRRAGGPAAGAHADGLSSSKPRAAMSAPWSRRAPGPGCCPSPSSIRGKCAPMPRRSATRRRPTRLMPTCFADFDGEVQARARVPLPDAATQALAALVVRRRQLDRDDRHGTTAPRAGAPDQSHFPRPTGITSAGSNTTSATSMTRLGPPSSGGKPRSGESTRTCSAVCPGVGPITARAASSPSCRNSGRLDRRAIAALVGVAPFNCDSGQHRGQRHIWGGRASVQTTLYMAAVSAARHKKPSAQQFYRRLRHRRQTGKSGARRHHAQTDHDP